MSGAADKVECVIGLDGLGERLGALRLRDASALEAMRRSLVRHGQLSPIVVFAGGEGLEVLDGFKRVHAARALGWAEVGARITDVADVVEAKIQLVALHERRGLSELEEGWLVRSLHRDDGVSQAEIGRQLGRHKSWVCRRLLLVEALDVVVQADVRLGLLVPRAAVALSALPRGNQRAAAEVVAQRGLTVRQTELLVAELLELGDEGERSALLARRREAGPVTAVPRTTPAPRSAADWIATDIGTLRRVAGRLDMRLRTTPLGAFGPASSVVLDGLIALAPALAVLARTVATITGVEEGRSPRDAALAQP